MKRLWFFKFVPVLVLLVSESGPAGASPALNSHPDWVGEYILRQTADAGEETWISSLSVIACSRDNCRYRFSSGGEQSECRSAGTLVFKNQKHAEDRVDVRASSDDGPRGHCLVSFDRRANGKILVDVKNEYANKKDEEFGEPCNTLCGFQGARYFGVEIPKVSETQFSNPSFSCLADSLSVTEKQICSSPDLAKKDRELADRLAKLKRDHPKQLARLTADERAWPKEREQKCAKERDPEACVGRFLEARLRELANYD